jgi:hypothetical protein
LYIFFDEFRIAADHSMIAFTFARRFLDLNQKKPASYFLN